MQFRDGDIIIGPMDLALMSDEDFDTWWEIVGKALKAKQAQRRTLEIKEQQVRAEFVQPKEV